MRAVTSPVHPSFLREVKQSAGIVGIIQRGLTYIRGEFPVVTDPRKLEEREIPEILQDLCDRVYPVRIEAESRFPHRKGEIEISTRCEDTRQFPAGVSRSVRVKRISIASQADMFRHMEAGEGSDGVVRHRESEDAPAQ